MMTPLKQRCIGIIEEFCIHSFQTKFLKAALGVELLAKVPLWIVGSGSCYYLYIPTQSRAQTFRADSDNRQSIMLPDTTSQTASPPSQLERWAFYKLSTLLGLQFDDGLEGRYPRFHILRETGFST
jgi:hypothetical protein